MEEEQKMNRNRIIILIIVCVFLINAASAADLIISSGTTTLSGTQTYENVIINGTGILAITAGSTLQFNVSGTFFVDTTGTISGNATGKAGGGAGNPGVGGSDAGAGGGGNGGGRASSKGAGGGGGGGYGGIGASGATAGGAGGTGGIAFGTSNGQDWSMGSGAGGGGWSWSANSGGSAGDRGGGGLRINAANITINGKVFLNGGVGGTGSTNANTYDYNSGGSGSGGSGGSLFLNASNVNIKNSIISVNGGSGGGGYYPAGYGGGGRVKIFTQKLKNVSSTVTVSGYATGTIYYNYTYIEPVLTLSPSINATGVNTTWTPDDTSYVNSYNYSVNGVWTNGTTNLYYFEAVLNQWVNVTVQAYSTTYGLIGSVYTLNTYQYTGTLPTLSASQNSTGITTSWTTVPDVTYNYSVNGDWTNGTTNLNTFLARTDGQFMNVTLWTYDATYGLSLNSVSLNTQFLEIPPTPSSISATSVTGINGRINTSWTGSSSKFSYSVNGVWTNCSSNTYHNESRIIHEWQNVTVFGASSVTCTLSSTGLSLNTQLGGSTVPSAPPGTSGLTTTITISAIGDTYVKLGSVNDANTNFGNSPFTFTANGAGTLIQPTAYALSQWNTSVFTSQIPANNVIVSAKMYIYMFGMSGCGYKNQPSSHMHCKLNVYDVYENWSESTATWNTRPDGVLNSNPFYTTDDLYAEDTYWLALDITDLAADWHDGYDNHGVYIAMSADGYATASAYARENIVQGFRPYLVIEYGTPASVTSDKNTYYLGDEITATGYNLLSDSRMQLFSYIYNYTTNDYEAHKYSETLEFPANAVYTMKYYVWDNIPTGNYNIRMWVDGQGFVATKNITIKSYRGEYGGSAPAKGSSFLDALTTLSTYIFGNIDTSNNGAGDGKLQDSEISAFTNSNLLIFLAIMFLIIVGALYQKFKGG